MMAKGYPPGGDELTAVSSEVSSAAATMVRGLRDRFEPDDAMLVLIIAMVMVFKTAEHRRRMTPAEFAAEVAGSLESAVIANVEDERGGLRRQ